MPVRKSVVAFQIFLILAALLSFYLFSTAVEIARTQSNVGKGGSPEYLFFLGILFVAGCVILLLFVTYENPFEGAPASVQGRQRMSSLNANV